MKLILEIKNEPTKDDILVYNGIEWIAIPKTKFLRQVADNSEAIENLKKQYENDFNNLKNQINTKLKDYHEIIKLLVKEN